MRLKVKVLLVSRSLPPTPTGSAVIVDNLSQAFTREEMVLAGKEPPGGLPRDRDPDLPAVVAAEGPRVWSIRGRGNHHLAILRAPLLVPRLVRLIRAEGCRAVIGVYPDAAYLFAAWAASRRTKTRFFPYFHNTYLECQRPGMLRSFARWLQPRVFRDATHVFTMSAGMSALYDRLYPGQFAHSPLVHSFNEPIPAFREPEVSAEPVLAFSGNVNASCLEAARRLFAAVGQMPGVRVQFFTGASERELVANGVWTANARRTCLPRPALPAALAACDVMLLPHGFSGGYHPVEYETIFPTKTIEYLISGRPILAHSPPGVFLTRFLREHDCALVVDEPDPAAVRVGLNRLFQDAHLRARLVRNSLKAAEQFHISRVGAHLRWELEMPLPEATGASWYGCSANGKLGGQVTRHTSTPDKMTI